VCCAQRAQARLATSLDVSIWELYDEAPLQELFVKRLSFLLASCALAASAQAAPQCKQQTVEKSVVEICMVPGAAFQHDVYTLKADNVLVFALIDDYVEHLELNHTIPEGLAIELPLSQQGEKRISIKGGCLPESKDGAEVGRICNFTWGRHQIVKDVRFTFD
jgi:hypothetical protein